MSGRVEIILGCMFSGKSTELIRRVSRYNAINFSTLIVNSMLDTRCGNDVITTHSNESKKAVKVERLMQITEEPNFNKIKVFGIDEAQFFPDLVDFVKYAERFHKIIIIAGLDGDFNREPFGQILNCIPLCDEVVKLTAMDMYDNDAQPAVFSKRLVKDGNQVKIGDKGEYIAVSRKNYLDLGNTFFDEETFI